MGARKSLKLGKASITVADDGGAASGDRVALCVRAEDIELRTGSHKGANRLAARVAFVRDLGHVVEVTADCAEGQLKVLVPAKDREGLTVDAPVTLHLPADACRVLTR